MSKINFKTISDDELLEMERKAWRGMLEYEDFPAPEYKFFDTVRRLGEQHRFDKVPAELLKDDVITARKVYRRERGELQYGLDINSKYQDAIRRADALLIAIEKAKGAEKLPLALECIECLTGEVEFAERNLRGGFWNDITDNDGVSRFKCSMCGSDFNGKFPFCPECGAKMTV